MEMRWAGWYFSEDGVGLIKERRWKDRMERMWRQDTPSIRGNRRVMLWERQYQDRYADPGSPEERRNDMHQYVLQTVPSTPAAANAADAVPVVYFMGSGASVRGDRPFVDARALEPGAEPVRLWRCPPGPSKGDGEEASEVAENEVGGELVPEEGRTPVFGTWRMPHVGVLVCVTSTSVVLLCPCVWCISVYVCVKSLAAPECTWLPWSADISGILVKDTCIRALRYDP